MFKQLIVLLAVGIYAVSCKTDGDNGLTEIDFEHTAYSDPEDDHKYGHQADHLEEHDVDNLRSKVQFGRENQYKGERGIPSSPPAYESLSNKLPTIEESRVLPDGTPTPPLQYQQQQPHVPLRDRVANRLATPGAGRRATGNHNLRADMKDYAINLRNNPKVVRGIEVVKGKTASFKDRLSTIKANHEQKKAARLNLQNGANFGRPVSNAFPAGSYEPRGPNTPVAPVEFEAAPATDYNYSKVPAYHH